MNTHSLQLADIPFNAIASGNKVIESRLYDDKRKLIQIGDMIEFINRDTPDRKVLAKVVGLLRYNTFHDLFSHASPSKFGGESVEWLENQINEFYSIEDQQQSGVIGIELELIVKKATFRYNSKLTRNGVVWLKRKTATVRI